MGASWSTCATRRRYTFLNTLFSVSEAVLYMQACTMFFPV